MKRLLVLFLILTGFGLQVDVVEATGFERGRELYQAGRSDQALAVLRDFVRTSGNEPETANAYALIGRILTRQNNYPEVILYLQRLPAHLRSPEIDLFHGNAMVAGGRYDEGARMLLPLMGELPAVDDQVLLYQALATAAVEENRFLYGVYYLARELELVGQSPEILDRIRRMLQNRLSDADLDEAAFMWQGTLIGQAALLQLARRELARQKTDQAAAYLNRLMAVQTDFPWRQEAEDLLLRTREDGWLNRNTIGVLLPLSGPYASYGELVVRGLELALKEHNKTRFPVRFVYRDTAAGADIRQLVRGLAHEDRVIAIIGPLLSADALEAGREAQQQLIPMLSLAQTEGLPQVGNFVFRDSITAVQQVETLVGYALTANRLSFSVLYPQTRQGHHLAQLFEAVVRRSGGEMVDVIGYPEGTTDFRAQIEQLLWRDRSRPISEERTGGLKEPEYPLAPFHALFIPDFFDNISLIAPQLMFYGIKDVLLLGTNGWYASELIPRAGRFLGDAVFIEAFYPDSRHPEVRRFVGLYRGEHQEEPTILEAQAFDVAGMMLRAVDQPRVANRDDLRSALLELDQGFGVTGTRGFDAEGEAVKKLNLLGIRRGRLTEIDY